jgi:type II secretory pathway component PulF
MRIFSYRAYTVDGRIAGGTIEARDETDALQKLNLQRLMPFEAAEARPSFWRMEIRLARRVRTTDVVLILRDLAALLEVSIAVDVALRLAAEQATAERRRRVLARLHEDMVAGTPLSDAMKAQADVFTPDHVAMVRAGELSGGLPTVLHDLCASLERELELRSRIVGALVYPAILLLIAAFALALVFFVMVPAITPLFRGQDRPLPLVISVAAGLTGFARTNGLWMAPALAVVALVGAGAARTEWFRRRRDRAVLGLPFIGKLCRDAEAARFARTLGILLRSGAAMPQALAVTAQAMRNAVCRRDLLVAVDRLTQGSRLMQALVEFAPLTESSRSLLSIGEETNRLPDVLMRVADGTERSLHRRIERLMTLLTPILTFAIGLIVGGIILSVMNAILSANDLAM